MRILTLLVLLLSGCSGSWFPRVPGLSPHKIDIQQGNYVTQDMVAKLKPGMTRSQVRYLLGTPMVADSFNKERWDYIYYLKKGRNSHVDSRRVTVYFDGDKVAKLDKPTAEEAAKQDASAAQIKNGKTY